MFSEIDLAQSVLNWKTFIEGRGTKIFLQNLPILHPKNSLLPQ